MNIATRRHALVMNVQHMTNFFVAFESDIATKLVKITSNDRAFGWKEGERQKA